MSRNSGNVSKTKNVVFGPANNVKPNRRSFQKLSESSSISSNRNSSAQSEEDVGPKRIVSRQQIQNNACFEDQQLLTKKLQGQIKELRHKLKVLEETVDSKDYSLGTIAREKDRAIGEIRRLEKNNKQLRQQLQDERNYYLEEKEKFCEEMARYKKKMMEVKANEEKKQNGKTYPMMQISQNSFRWQLNKGKGDYSENKETSLRSSKSQRLPGLKEHINPLGNFSCSESQIRKTSSLESFYLYEGNDQSLQMAALKTENAKLRSIICERDERNYELCLRFLRMKHFKNDIRSRFNDLENEYLQVITNLMEKIDDARQEFNFIVDQKFKKPLHSTNAMYLRLVQRNSRMAFENASLRVENQCLKKELNKHLNGNFDLDRKIDQQPSDEYGNHKLILGESKSEGKLKKSAKKNVNFKELRTIYRKDLDFKNSDTDSNYISKTSTTVPSNGSIVDNKSNDSAKEGGKVLQSNKLSDDILQKLFKKVNMVNKQILEGDFKETLLEDFKGVKNKTSEKKSKENKSSSPMSKISKDSGKSNVKQDSKSLLNKRESIKNSEMNPKRTDSSSPDESKKPLCAINKDTMNSFTFFPNDFNKFSDSNREFERFDKNDFLQIKQRKEDNSKAYSYNTETFFNPVDSDSEITSSFDYCPMKWGKNSIERKKSLEDRTVNEDDILKTQSVKDSCGLEEKIEVSQIELPKIDLSEINKITSKTKLLEPNMSDEKVIFRKGSDVLPLNQIPSSISISGLDTTRTRSVEENRSQIAVHGDTDNNLETTYRLDEKEDLLQNDNLIDSTKPLLKVKGALTNPEELETAQTRRHEGSKRFSHRLVSTSPEQLRNLLTDSQLEACYRMTPIIVGHTTTETNSGFSSQNSNNEIVLQFVIPTNKLGQSPKILVDSGIAGKENLGKETSTIDLQPLPPELPSEVNSSEINIPMSNLPTSNSTIEMVDSEANNERANIMLRTLSAPGLLESSWLDPYIICEMRDCGTNT